MSKFLDSVKARAKADKKTIVLPESMDRRTFEAAETILKEGICNLVIIGTPVTIFFWVAVILWITKGMWWLMLIDLLIQATYGIWATNYYYNNVGYICPECHEVFKPDMKEFFFAYHTPKMRRLTCKKCNHHGLCIEVFTGKEDSNNG